MDQRITGLMSHLFDRMMRGFAKEARALIEPHFSKETAQPGTWLDKLPSSGHCVMASMFIFIYLGARCNFVSTEISGQSHWWVRCHEEYCGAEIDITADQFGHSPVLVSVSPEGLRPESEVRVRRVTEIDKESKERFILFMSRITEIDYEEAKRYLLDQ